MSRIETLIGEMTLAEKLGQLTMTASGYAVTGPIIAGDSTAAIRDGTIGNLLNMVGAAHVREMQRLVVEESRLGIPLLIGFDVVHGHRILFPVPLGEAALFDPETWALTARESAKEAAAEGLAMTFAPMLDVSRDPRWGRSVEGPGEDPWLGARLRFRRHLRAYLARSAHAVVRGGGCLGRGGRHARVHGSCGNTHDGAQGAAARMAARSLGLQGRDRQRLQRHCGTHASRHRCRPR